MSIQSRLERLEKAVVALANPRKWIFPFGVFNSPQEVHEHPLCGEYIEQKRREICPAYAEIANKFETQTKKENGS